MGAEDILNLKIDSITCRALAAPKLMIKLGETVSVGFGMDRAHLFDSETDECLPERFSLAQNYPNPFNPATEISFDLPRGSWVRLEVFNLIGQRVAILADSRFAAGHHTIRWDAGNCASGIYLYRIETDGFTAARKMVLLK